MITGVYISNNSEPVLEGPDFGDKLILYNNNTFKSDTWGEGTFRLKYSFFETRIVLKYGGAIYNSYFYRPFFFGAPRISLFRDLNYYYEKIE